MPEQQSYVQLDFVNSMLDYEAKVIGAMDVRETIIEIMENQEGPGLKLQAIVKEIERLKNMVNVLDKATIKCSNI